MTFGEKVKAGRTKLGLTQEELANKIGVTVRVICSYEKDKSLSLIHISEPTRP